MRVKTVSRPLEDHTVKRNELDARHRPNKITKKNSFALLQRAQTQHMYAKLSMQRTTETPPRREAFVGPESQKLMIAQTDKRRNKGGYQKSVL